MSDPHYLFDLVYREPDNAHDMEEKPESWTVLRWLKERGIMSIYKTDSGFEAQEHCDLYFKAPLTREHLLQLAEELKQLAEGA